MINTREIAEEYRLSHWAEVMQERQAGGLSIKAFCRQIGIGTNTYFYWQRRVRAAACQEMVPVATDLSEKTPAPHGWAICAAEEAAPAPKALTVEIGAFRIIAERDVDPEQLAKVCRVLVSLC